MKRRGGIVINDVSGRCRSVMEVGQDLRTLWRTLEPRPLTRSPRLRRQHVLLTVAVEFTHEIPYCPPNAMDVADPPAHFTYVWYRQYQIHFRRCSELWGGDPEIFERRVKVLDSYQELRVHHPSLPPDLHPFQVMNT